MPENFFADTQKNPTPPSRLDWYSIQVDWPYDALTLQVEIFTTRRLDAFQWLVGAILFQNGDNIPALKKIVQDLGILQNNLLYKPIEDLVLRGFCAWRDLEQEHDLANLYMTEPGVRFFNEDRIQSLPERHGITLYFDAITRAYCFRKCRPADANPTNPILDPSTLDPVRTGISTDHLRSILKERQEPFFTDKHQIREIQVQKGVRLWLSQKLVIGIDSQGHAVVRMEKAMPYQETWLQKQSVVLESLWQTGSIFPWPAEMPAAIPLVPFDEWWNRTERLVAPAALIHEVVSMIRNARSTLTLHPLWQQLPNINDAVNEALSRGVTLGPPENGDEDVIIRNDQGQVIQLNRIWVKSPSGQSVEIPVASIPRKLKGITLPGSR